MEIVHDCSDCSLPTSSILSHIHNYLNYNIKPKLVIVIVIVIVTSTTTYDIKPKLRSKHVLAVRE